MSCTLRTQEEYTLCAHCILNFIHSISKPTIMFYPNLKHLSTFILIIASLLINNLAAQEVPVYRYYNPSADVHLWTASPQHEVLTGYHLEGIAFYAPATGIPIKCYVNPKVRHRMYTVRPKHENLDGYIIQYLSS